MMCTLAEIEIKIFSPSFAIDSHRDELSVFPWHSRFYLELCFQNKHQPAIRAQYSKIQNRETGGRFRRLASKLEGRETPPRPTVATSSHGNQIFNEPC
jgi:hypothetical protein